MSTIVRWFREISNEEIISLARVEQLNPVDWQKLVRSFSSLAACCKASVKELVAAGLTDHQALALQNRSRNVSNETRLLRQHDISVLTIADKRYPALLRQIDDPPLWLFYRGDISVANDQLATIVGTRKPSPYAQAVIDQLLPDSILSQIVTVSGLAYGVDALIHRRSIVARGKTIAVLAGGLDAIYPTTHTALAKQIVDEGGLLLSEYPPLMRPQPYRFPIRNRIVAGLSPVTIIIEARIQSGTLTTAKSAIDYNRDVWAVPGRVTDEAASGTNFLIKNGANLFDSQTQLAQYFNLKAGEDESVDLDTPEGQLLHLLTGESYDLDQLMAKTGLTVEKILGLVTRLELTGSIFQDGAGRYSAKKHG